MITAEDVKLLSEQLGKYEETSFGVKYGEDFPVIARIVGESGIVDNATVVLMLSGMLLPLSLPDELRKRASAGDPQASKEIADRFKNDPLTKSEVLRLVYLGYRLGRKDAETEQLEKLVK
jgi:hypothetical protein